MKWEKVTETEKHYFEIGKAGERAWFIRAIDKATQTLSGLTGFNTKKQCLECAEIWAGWMK